MRPTDRRPGSKAAPPARPGALVVAIPARNEEQRVGDCLDALAGQTAVPDHIVLLVNNSADRTAAAARRVRLDRRTTLHVRVHVLPPRLANVGHARRLALDTAAALAGPAGLLLTTDADSRADPDWIAANLDAIADGADAVAGTIELDPVEWGQIPQALHRADASECAYDGLCDEIHALLDPDPNDPWPRHTCNGGASIAVTAAAYRQAGGLPDVPCGEDRALVAALRRIDARIRHAPACRVLVSGRTEGRAPGGMADTIRRRLIAPDRYLDDRLEPADVCARRAWLRRLARQAWRDRSQLHHLALATELNADTLSEALARPYFGAAWADLETAIPGLARVRVPVAELARQTARASEIRDRLRQPAMAVPGRRLAASHG